MNIEVSQLTKDLVVYLTPALPFLQTIGKDVAEKAQKKLGEEVWQKTQKIWEVLNYNIELKPTETKALLKSAVKDVAEIPEDEDAQASLRLQLKKILKEDENLAKKLYELLQDENKNTKAKFHTKINGNIQGFVQGDENDVTMNFGVDKSKE